MFEESEKRHFHRVFYNAKAKLCTKEQNWDCDVLDLSLNGCLLRFPSPWQESSEKTFILKLRLSDSIEIKMELKIAHLLENKVGFKCEQMDLDSITQLRRIVELNVGNSEILERDLTSLAEKAYN